VRAAGGGGVGLDSIGPVASIAPIVARAATAAKAVISALAAIAAMAMLLAWGCRQTDDSAAIRERLRSKDVAQVVREAAAVRYTLPADGRLTDGQVRMYLLVRERECRIREAAALEAQGRRAAAAGADRTERPERQERPEKQERLRRSDRPDAREPSERQDRHDPRDGRARGAALPAATTAAAAAAGDEASLAAAADLRAAQEVKVNPKEYAWVRARVVEAEAAATTQTLYQKMAAGREQLLARMRRDRDALTDPEQRAAAEREIEDWKRGLQAAEPPVAPAVRANIALLARYREPLARLRALEERTLAAAAGLAAPGASGGR
jgi:hypothetical protein